MKASQVFVAVLLLVLTCAKHGCLGDGHDLFSRKIPASVLDDSSVEKCGATFQKIAPCLVINTTQCSQAELKLQPCVMWVLSQPSDPQPPQDCCSALVSVEQMYPMCFCLLTFYPPSAFNRTLQSQSPRRCNITTDLCQKCPPLLTALPTGQPFPSDPTCAKYANSSKRNFTKAKILAWTLSIIGGLLVGISLIIGLAVWRRNNASSPQLLQEQEEIARIEGRPTIFSYKILKTATRNFHHENKLGEGGFGEVFKGVLPDGKEVAVKRLLTRSRQGKREFLNEVTLITSVQHRNLVKLKGCCLHRDERLLVYEFLENKSLYQALFDPRYPIVLDWPSRLKIAIGTARGLAYLHEGCHTRIIHRDVKASNILLDKDLEPKISDFGLAKLVHDTQSHISTRVAGTVGYLSPEYAMRGQLTEKADVFSYGIVLLELLSGRTNVDLRLPTDMAYLLDWIWQLYEEERLMDIIDPRLKKADGLEEEILKVAQVALLCTQNAVMRPSMARVVSLLSGDSDLAVPEMVKPSLRHFDGLRPDSKSYRKTRQGESPESHYIFNSNFGSGSNYVSNVEPR
ncbi:unnamed protein product [Calypogeia fissa]